MRVFLLFCLLNVALCCDLLILGGGGSKGAWQGGVLSHLVENGMKWDTVKGYSVGSINAAFYGLINDIELGKNLWGNLTNADIYRFKVFKMGKGIYDTTPLRKFIERVFNGKIKHSPGGAKVEIVATNIINGRSVIKSANDDINSFDELSDWLMASMAVPILFPPIKIGDSWYWDGQVRDTGFGTSINCPHPQSITVISTYPDDYYYEITDMTNVIGLTNRLYYLYSTFDYPSLLKRYIGRIPVLFCRPLEYINEMGIGDLDFSNGARLWKQGYDDTEKACVGLS